MKPGVKTVTLGAVALLLGACVIPLAVVLPLVPDYPDEMQFETPGTAEVTIEKPGRYYLWSDSEIEFKDESDNHPEGVSGGPEIVIRSKETNEPFDFVSDTSIFSTSAGSSKNSVGYIDAQAPGVVEIEVTGPAVEQRIFSFSRFPPWPVVVGILTGIYLSLTLCLFGFVAIIWGIVKLVKTGKKPELSQQAGT